MTSPFGPLVVIANPRAGHGRVARCLSAVRESLQDQGLDHRIVSTERPGHATHAAREALAGGERYLVAVGGDGTVNEVVNGMLDEAGRPLADGAVLGVVAAGSGCDLVRSFGLPGDAQRAARHLAGEAVRPMDLGRLSTPQGTRYFANIAEVGLGAAVVARAQTLPGFLGGAKYLAGFWLTLPGFRPAQVRAEADGHAYAWRAHNLVVANGRFYGGGMQISPKSAPDDGVLDVLVMAGPKSDAFTGLPRVYRGTHLPHPNIVELTAARLTVDADPPLPIEADGELLGTTPVTFEVLSRPITLKV